jgi:hypothetical protein
MVDISIMQASSVTSSGPNWLKHSCFPPASRLVGVELNPGPPKKGAHGAPGKQRKKPGSQSQRALSSTMVGAAVSSSLRQSFSFSAGSRAGALKMCYRTPLVQLGSDGAGGGLGILRPDGYYCSSVGIHADCIDNQIQLSIIGSLLLLI